MHINSLPDLVLHLIFSELSFHDLLNAGHVCALWKSYQMEIGKQVRSLALLLGPNAQCLITNSCFTLKYHDLLLNEDGTRMYSSQYLSKRYHLTLGSFFLGCVDRLANVFPHITTLEIAIIFVEPHFDQGQMAIVLSHVKTLLAKWSPMLKSLKMFSQFNYRPRELLLSHLTFLNEANEFVNLLDMINSMKSLQHLTFDTNTSIEQFLQITGLPNSIDLPILGQLHEFYFKSSDFIHIIKETLKSFAVSNDNLKQIGLEYASHVRDLELPQLVSKIVHIPFGAVLYRITKLPNTFKQFSSLTYLYLMHSNVNLFDGSLNSLASLPQLTHLHYRIVSYNVQYSAPKESSNQLLQLSSVQVLTITDSWDISVGSKPKSDLESNLWAYLFPNVQVVELNMKIKCPLVRVVDFSFLSKQELNKTLSPFVYCSKLHHIFTCEKFISDISEVSEFAWIVVQEGDRKIIVNVEI